MFCYNVYIMYFSLDILQNNVKNDNMIYYNTCTKIFGKNIAYLSFDVNALVNYNICILMDNVYDILKNVD